MRKTIVIMAVMLLSCALHADSGTLFCREIGIPEGLASDKVTALVEDDWGRLWIGTHKGVNCFDSKNIETMNALGNSRITALFRMEGRIVVCSVSGMAVCTINTGQWREINCNGHAIQNVSSGFSDGNELTFVTSEGICSFDGNDVKLIRDNSKGIQQITKDKFDDIWESSQHKIYRTDSEGKGSSEYTLPITVSNQTIAGLFCESSGNVWAWSSSGELFRFSRTANKFIREELTNKDGHILNTANIGCMQENNKGRLFIGYHDGIISFDSNDRVASLLDCSNYSFDRLHTVTALECSSNGDIFAGSFFNGVFIVSPAAYAVSLFRLNGGRSSSTVANNILEREDGSLLIGTNNNSLVIIDEEGRNLRQYPGEARMPADVLTVISDPDGNIWTGLQYSGLFRIGKHGDVASILPKKGHFSGACISDIFPAGNDTIFIANENGIDLLDPSTMEVHPFIVSKSNCQYFGAFAVGSNVIFLNHNSLFCIDRYSGNHKEVPAHFEGESTFRSGCSGFGDKLILGTDNGEIMSYDPVSDTFQILNNQTFKGSEISNLIIDKSGSLWAASGNRIAEFNIDGRCVHTFNMVNILGRRLFNMRSSALCSNGDIVFGTTDGVLRFSPDELIETSQYRKSIHFSGFQVNNQSVSDLLDKGIASISEDGLITIPHNLNLATLDFSVIDFSPFCTRDDHYISSKVNSGENGWVDTPEESIKSPELRTGKYTVDLRLCNADGVILSTDTLNARIKPHWLASAPMIAVFAILFCILSCLYFLQSKKIRKKKEEKFRLEESRKINDIFNTKRLNLLVNMGNEFKAPISIVSSAVSSEEVPSIDLIRSNVNKMRFLVDQMLDLEKFGLSSSGEGARIYDFSQFVRLLCDKLAPQLKKNKIQLQIFGCDKVIPVLFEAGKMELILCNVLKHISNAALIDSDVELSLESEGPAAILKISGKMNSNPDTKEEIGINIAHCLCELSGYGLEESISEGNGTLCDILTIPLRSDELRQMENLDQYGFEITDRIAGSVANEGFSPVEFRDSEGHRKYSLLIIDNDTEHIELLKRSLRQDMHVRGAKNGEEALSKLASGTFDIVLSEIDLADMSGYDLCKAIKSNETGRTAPVILMSYGMTEQKRLMALTANADQTIEKPITLPALFLMIRNLLQSDEKMRNKIMEIRGLDVSIQKMNRSDDKMMDKAVAFIKAHLSENISINQMSETLGLSRTRLYSDFKRITDLTPADFVLKIKMQEACSLLENTDLTASEISYKLGYCNPNHFNRQFKSIYNITPISWRKHKCEKKP